MAIMQVTPSTDRPPSTAQVKPQQSNALKRCDLIIILITEVLGDGETESP